MRCFLCFFIFVYFSINAQTELDQQIFRNKVWKSVTISSNKQSFFDRKDKYLGSKEDYSSKTIYKDKWKRVIKVVANPNFVRIPTNKKRIQNKRLDSNSRIANQVSVRRNKAIFYDNKGQVSRTVKRRGKKVFFHDSEGKLIGYKIYKRDGTKIYKDQKGRITGRSSIDKTGRLIYRAKNKRTRTPRVLFEDPFIYSS
jgi:hypothetical protein